MSFVWVYFWYHEPKKVRMLSSLFWLHLPWLSKNLYIHQCSLRNSLEWNMVVSIQQSYIQKCLAMCCTIHSCFQHIFMFSCSPIFSSWAKLILEIWSDFCRFSLASEWPVMMAEHVFTVFIFVYFVFFCLWFTQHFNWKYTFVALTKMHLANRVLHSYSKPSGYDAYTALDKSAL